MNFGKERDVDFVRKENEILKRENKMLRDQLFHGTGEKEKVLVDVMEL